MNLTVLFEIFIFIQSKNIKGQNILYFKVQFIIIIIKVIEKRKK